MDDPSGAWRRHRQGDLIVYHRCRDILLRIIDTVDGPQQAYLSSAGHASLLLNKPRGGPPTTVPDVVHNQWHIAAAELRNARLEPLFTGSVVTGAWVEAQRPTAGAVVAGGNTVRCDLRTGQVPTTDQTFVPDVRGATMDAAEAVLRKAGLRPVFQGAGMWVFGQTPAADAVVNRGTRVTCRVRAGRPPEQ